MNLIFYFTIALVLSFLGSIPTGLITLTITQQTIEKGRQAGIMISLGAVIMEFIYTYIALISLEFFAEETIIGTYIKIFTIFLFTGLGIYFLIKKNNPEIEHSSSYDYFDFLRGIVVGMMNVLIIPFWIILGIWLQSNGILFEESSFIISFSLGSAIGALIAFLGYVWFSEWIVQKIKKINLYINKAIGILFLSLGMFQVIQQFL